jgi:hypothetical protein
VEKNYAKKCLESELQKMSELSSPPITLAVLAQELSNITPNCDVTLSPVSAGLPVPSTRDKQQSSKSKSGIFEIRLTVNCLLDESIIVPLKTVILTKIIIQHKDCLFKYDLITV